MTTLDTMTLEELGTEWVETFVAMCAADDPQERRLLLARLDEIEAKERDLAD